MVVAPRALLLSSFLLTFAACGGSPPAEREQGKASPRIVALVPSLTEIVVAVGGVDHLVARTDYDDAPAVASLPSVGGGLDPSFEALVGLGVDIVLMTAAREAATMDDRLASLGIEMILLPANTVGDVYAAIHAIGALVDHRAEADSLAARLRSGLSALEHRLAGVDTVAVLYALWSDPPMTTGGGTFVDELIGLAGGRNVFGELPAEWPTVGFESIVERRPDVVVWPRGADGSGTLATVRAMPGWRDVPAVQAGHVVFIDAQSFNQPGPEMVASALELARALHPEAF